MENPALPVAPAPAPSAPPAPRPAPPPATVFEKAAWILMAAGILFILEYRLLPALLAGLFVYSLVHLMACRISGRSLSHHHAKLVAVALIGLVVVGVAIAAVFLLIAFLKGHMREGLPHLLDSMAAIIERFRQRLPWLPAAEAIKEAIARGLREHSRELQHIGGEAGRILVHALVGIVVGALASFEATRPAAPLGAAISERLARLSRAFEKVVFAQVRISLLNTVFTAIYLLAALPLFGVHLPFRHTLVAVTFLVGLIPVLGNLVSNTAIVIISLGSSPAVAVSSLAFLVVIHKLEYFMNAKIVGSQIHAKAWEILIAMLVMEAAFGIPGVILAPIVYAYVKQELTDRGLV